VTRQILFVSGEYPPDVGGVGDYTDRLRHALAWQGWQSSVLSRRQVRHWDARALVWLLRAAPRDGLVHIQFQAAAYDLLGDVCMMPTLLRRMRPGVCVVTTFHDVHVPYLFPRAAGLRRGAVNLLARTSHAVIAADERDIQSLGGPSCRHHQVPIGPNIACEPGAAYDRTTFRTSYGLKADTLAIVYFGLLNHSKGLELLIDAFELILTKMPAARLLLLGGEAGASDPTDRHTAAGVRCRLNRLGERVVRTGWLRPQALSEYLLAADVALLPYADGASPRRGSLLACAEHGLPIVSTQPASPAVADAVHAVPPDAAILAAAVLEVAQDAALSARLRESTATLAARTNWSRIAAAHVQIYQQIASSRGKGGLSQDRVPVLFEP
jgi:glycosyltransferase involved in cell wall biosynthesis